MPRVSLTRNELRAMVNLVGNWMVWMDDDEGTFDDIDYTEDRKLASKLLNKLEYHLSP